MAKINRLADSYVLIFLVLRVDFSYMQHVVIQISKIILRKGQHRCLLHPIHTTERQMQTCGHQ